MNYTRYSLSSIVGPVAGGAGPRYYRFTHLVEGGGLFEASPLTLRVAASGGALRGGAAPSNRVDQIHPGQPSPFPCCTTIPLLQDQLHLVEGGGFEPPKLSRQIYSLIPLAAREPLRIFCRLWQHGQNMELARGVEPPTG